MNGRPGPLDFVFNVLGASLHEDLIVHGQYTIHSLTLLCHRCDPNGNRQSLPEASGALTDSDWGRMAEGDAWQTVPLGKFATATGFVWPRYGHLPEVRLYSAAHGGRFSKLTLESALSPEGFTN